LAPHTLAAQPFLKIIPLALLILELTTNTPIVFGQQQTEVKIITQSWPQVKVTFTEQTSKVSVEKPESTSTPLLRENEKPPAIAPKSYVLTILHPLIELSLAQIYRTINFIWKNIIEGIIVFLPAYIFMRLLHLHPSAKIKNSIKSPIKRGINWWLARWACQQKSDTVIPNSDVSGRPMKDAIFSYQISERKKLYRVMDIVFLFFKIRHIPAETTTESNQAHPPCAFNDNHVSTTTSQNNTISIVEHPENKALLDTWKAYFSELCNLIRHDDALNWQKFHYFMAIFGIIISAFVISFNAPRASGFGNWSRIVLALAGIAISLIADRTFQEGLRCLRGHRRKLYDLEREGIHQSAFLFGMSTFNQRDGLEIGPAITFLISIGLLAISFLQAGLI
jgi:hypothetical protein